jgi:hypothetical protein
MRDRSLVRLSVCIAFLIGTIESADAGSRPPGVGVQRAPQATAHSRRSRSDLHRARRAIADDDYGRGLFGPYVLPPYESNYQNPYYGPGPDFGYYDLWGRY